MRALPWFVLSCTVTIMAGCGTHASSEPTIYKFEECVSAGYAVMKSDPPKCSTPDGRIFTGIKGYSDVIIAQRADTVDSYEDCVARGYAILKSLPPQCVTPDGKHFVQGQKTATKQLCKDTCGDGNCDEIVCMAEGCPCAETQASCPKDCH